MKKLIQNLIEDMYLPRMPFWMIAIIVVSVVASWVPLAFIARGRTVTSKEPAIRIFQDMYVQPRFDAQRVNPIFADQRSMRLNPAGTVSRDQIIGDDHFSLGYETDANGRPELAEPTEAGGPSLPKYYDGYPERVDVDLVFVKRGQNQFATFCTPCHGIDGLGGGAVNERATMLAGLDGSTTTWVAASNLLDLDPTTGQLKYGETAYPNGRLYNTIANGIRNMKGYGDQITVEDRWAIVAYVRALQLSQRATEKDVPVSELGNLPE
ncbi:c-type cytochrome [Poriferisphaera sp. WC338]|uniref:c-type cytochrome n=1 Tax=Poriferisphaera sp. WC338 TaxID=3425129 RepID=UPI003D813488